MIAALSVSQVAHADQWDDQVRAQLGNAASIMIKDGMQIAYQASVDDMREGSKATLRYRLEKGVSYIFFGACDNDCNDIDFTMFDGEGDEVASDTQSDAAPAVTVTPRYSDEFTLQVNMYHCGRNPCSYGVIVGRQ